MNEQLRIAGKQALYRFAPGAYRRMLDWRNARRSKSAPSGDLERQVREAVMARCGSTVMDGPFKGMRYVSFATGSAFLPKIVGSYEAELSDALRAILQRRYDVIVDVGCAEGYYAVGLARAFPNATVYAFDTNPTGQMLCAEMAVANAVADRVVIRGHCDVTALKETLRDNCLLISDCEGFEDELLRPDLVPQLKQCDVLVELHEQFVSGVTERILQRFAATHQIEIIQDRERSSGDYPFLAFLPEEQRRIAMDEYRGGAMMSWAFMRRIE